MCLALASLILAPVLIPISSQAANNRTGLVDEDDVAFRSFKQRPHFRSYIPPQTDLSPRFPAIRSQGDQGSCVAWATGYYMRTYYENIQGKNNDVPFSPAYIYNQIKLGNCDQGSRISDALKLMTTKGIVPLKSFPYSDASCSTPPSIANEKLAQSYKIKDWSRVNHTDIEDLRGTLSRGHPVIFGMRVGQAFDEFEGGKIFDTVTPKDGFGHAMVLVGYDDTRSAFKLANSWGPSWGDQGYAWLSYEAYLKNANYAFVADPGFDPLSSPYLPGKKVKPKPKPKPEPIQIVKVEPKPKPIPPPNPRPSPEAEPVVKVIVPPKPKAIPINTSDVEDLLSEVDCANLSATYTDTGAVKIHGFAGSIKHLGNIGREILSLAGVTSVKLKTKIRAWPQCEALQTFEAPLATNFGLRATVLSKVSPPKLNAGEYLAIQITAPRFASYLYVTYLQAGGDAVHLQRPFWLDAPLEPGKTLTLGIDKTKTRFKIQKPYGKEMIMVIASEHPLFETRQSIVEEERQYLTAFRRAILGLEKAYPNNKITATFVDLRTVPRR